MVNVHRNFSLLYAALSEGGWRECCRLRVRDVDLVANQIVVRSGKGDKDRVTLLPAAVKAALAAHLEGVKEQHRRDLQDGAGWVELPDALMQKYSNAGREWVWQWVFPAARMYTDRVSRHRRRHHLRERIEQNADNIGLAPRKSAQLKPSGQRRRA